MPNDTQRIIGRLEAFERMAIDEFKVIRDDLGDLKDFKSKIKTHSGYVAFIVAGVLTALIETAVHWLTGSKS